jgi:hypothetical protein
VELKPQGAEDKAEGSTLGRLSIDKHFHGDLEAVSRGQMLSATTESPASAGYVALERVSGTLRGRRGSFVLQHSGTMSSSGTQMSVAVVPDSGSGQLVGLSGTMAIRIVEGRHFYDLEFALPDVA